MTDKSTGSEPATSNTRTGGFGRVRAHWNRIREPWWARWMIDLGLIALLFFAITAYQTRNLVDEGKRVPATTLQTAAGAEAPLVDPDADRTLVYFWAPWCGVCDVETGTVDWARSLMGESVAVRSVVLDYRSPEQARKSAREKGIDYPVLLGNRTIQRRFHIDAFPTFYVLSKEGDVLSSSKGYTTTLGLFWRAWM